MNRICELLSVSYPILQGGMGNISSSELASAVSNAGGLGTIGAGTMSPDEVEKLMVEMKARTSLPFALNIPINVTPHFKEMCELAVKHNVKVVSLSAGNPSPYIPYFKEHGIKVICVTASVKHAKKAESAGADIIVGEGFEAAGINSTLELTTLTLIPQLKSSVSIPVVAAGGVGDGKGLAAAFVLGADGVQMGTRLVATKDSPYHAQYLEQILQSNDTGTVVVGRSVGQVRRLLKTKYSTMLEEAEKNGVHPIDFAKMTGEDKHIIGAIEGRLEEGFINGGQVSGLIDSLPTVEELFLNMMQEATEAVEHQIAQLNMFKQANH
ncbi:NAD(P)H-dependent flavin oxidoreductase [Guptibacillus algicola]|uniref:NAD(P)H-dependent flavin oxidoreductase n=1 Tax=Guptibacillus algicola TaxID=225844 RepID=UPI001CD65FDB|nr:nitronate monooxygenase [Alkalihalobacillus algicola]MCA0989142.1 nitronate monooxygenase [Alkalihalobacillus algicola]